MSCRRRTLSCQKLATRCAASGFRHLTILPSTAVASFMISKSLWHGIQVRKEQVRRSKQNPRSSAQRRLPRDGLCRTTRHGNVRSTLRRLLGLGGGAGCCSALAGKGGHVTSTGRSCRKTTQTTTHSGECHNTWKGQGSRRTPLQSETLTGQPAQLSPNACYDCKITSLGTARPNFQASARLLGPRIKTRWIKSCVRHQYVQSGDSILPTFLHVSLCRVSRVLCSWLRFSNSSQTPVLKVVSDLVEVVSMLSLKG